MAIRSILRPPRKIGHELCDLINGVPVNLSRFAEGIRRYSDGVLGETVQEAIHDAAMNPRLSQDVIAKAQSRLSVARKKYLRLVLISGGIAILPQLVVPLLAALTNRKYWLLSGHQIAGPGATNALFIWEASAAYFCTRYFYWRSANRLGYIADYLARSLQHGLEYYSDPTNIEFRDQFAGSIQRAATRYATVFKRSTRHPRFFAVHVRSVARGCRNDILSLIPALVTANCDEIAAINRDLARLMIRSQTGYWHETKDIVKHGAVVPKRDAVQISILTFIKDRSIQVAFMALIAALIGTTVPSILSH